MFKFFARKLIERMSARYDYDVSYLHYLLAEAPQAFSKFMRAGALSRHRERAPIEAAFTVQLLATMAEECGSCTQLIVNFAKDANMSTEQIEAVLNHNAIAMSPAVALAYRYADAVLHCRADATEARDAVRARWGDKGVIDLAMAMQGARLYPMMKNALGFARECRRVSVDGRWITVAKRAA